MSNGMATAELISRQIELSRSAISGSPGLLAASLPLYRIIRYSAGARSGASTAACILAMSYNQAVLVVGGNRALTTTRRLIQAIRTGLFTGKIGTAEVARRMFAERQFVGGAWKELGLLSLLVTDLEQRITVTHPVYKHLISEIAATDPDFIWVQLGGWQEPEEIASLKRTSATLDKIILHVGRAKAAALRGLGEQI